MNPPSPDSLENLIDRTLRAMPDRRAPASLEARVIAEISRREALPWFRRSWSHWPRPAQAGFLVGAAALTAFAIRGAALLVPGAGHVFSYEIPGFRGLATLPAACQDTLNTMAGVIPPFWRFAAVAVVAAGYCALTGLGVAAYRTLSLQRQP